MAQCQALVYADSTFKAHSHLKPSLCRTPGGVKKAPNGAVLGVYCRHHFEALYPHVGRCAGCRWWARDHRALGTMPGGHRMEPMIAGDSGVCLLTETKVLDPEHPDSRAVVWEGDSYTGALVTAADFGCVQWEASS